jgi:hypothetical protein
MNSELEWDLEVAKVYLKLLPQHPPGIIEENKDRTYKLA